jgi:hypothetical protein
MGIVIDGFDGPYLGLSEKVYGTNLDATQQISPSVDGSVSKSRRQFSIKCTNFGRLAAITLHRTAHIIVIYQAPNRNGGDRELTRSPPFLNLVSR